MSLIELQKLLRRVLAQTGKGASRASCAQQLGQLDAAGEARRPMASLMTLLEVSLDDLSRVRQIRDAYEAGYTAGAIPAKEDPGG